MKLTRVLAPLIAISFAQAVAQAVPPPGANVQMIAPVFHEQVLFSLPGTFQVTAPEHTSSKSYLREIPLRGETVDRWTQMVTLSGANGLVLKPNGTAQNMGDLLARQYRSSCPDSFAAQPPQKGKISGKDANILLMSCGSVQDQGGRPGARHSETALILVIQGAADMYTLQWAERGPAVEGPLKLDDARWIGRLKTLQPVKICPLAGGTAACLAQ